MPKQPVFSVVIPCFNYGRYLSGALDSVLVQNRGDVEIILVDDASTDDTADVAKGYRDRIQYVRNDHNLGAGGAWCRGLSMASGRFLIKLDADDELLPGCLRACESAFELEQDIGVVISSVVVQKEHTGTSELQFVTESDRTLGASELRGRLLHSFFFRMPGCVLRRSILDGHEPPDPALYQVHDWEYFLRVTRGHKARLLHKPAAIYRVHDQSITATAQFDNRLYNDIRLWLEIAQLPGDRGIEARELRVLRGSCAELMLIGFGSKLKPSSYVHYAGKYFKAVKLSLGGGFGQFLRLHVALFMRIVRKLKYLWPRTG